MGTAIGHLSGFDVLVHLGVLSERIAEAPMPELPVQWRRVASRFTHLTVAVFVPGSNLVRFKVDVVGMFQPPLENAYQKRTLIVGR